VNAFTIAALALVAGYLPVLWAAARRRAIDGLVALEVGGAIGVLVLLCLAAGFHRSFEYALAVTAAVLSWTGGLVVARFLGRWL
jgi:multisubunit Na+/H+ antiporter MnhF subunit